MMTQSAPGQGSASPTASPTRTGVLLGAILLLFLLLWFGRAAFGGWWMLDRSSTADTYLLSTIYERWAMQVRGGHLPLWFQEFAAGYPIHAAWMYGLFYPPLVLFAILPPEIAWTWLAMLHIVFGALGMYAFLWQERRDATAAASGALVFALSGFVLGRIACGHLNLVMPLAWTPWVLRSTLRVVRGERGAAAGLGLCMGFGLLAGHVQVWFYAIPLVVALAVFESMRRRVLRSALPQFALGTLVALGIAAIQWVPAWELFAVSGHPAEKPSILTACSVPGPALVAQVAPRYLTSRAVLAHEYLGLAGPLAVLTALLGFHWRDRRRLFWFATLVFGVVLAMGLRNELSRIANELPPFRFARAPGRALVLVVLAGSVLTGHCVADHVRLLSARWRALLPAAFIVSAVAFGVPRPGAIRGDFYRSNWTQSLPFVAPEHRVRVWRDRYPYPERFGGRTLRDVCPLDTPGYRALNTLPLPIVAWWFDVAAEVQVPWGGPPADAAATQGLATRAQVRRFETPLEPLFFTRVDADVGDEEILACLRRGDRTLWVEGISAESDPLGTASAATTRRVTRLPTSSPSEIEYRLDPGGPGWLLVPEKWYPGWKRYDTEEGRWRQVRRGNLALIAVETKAANLRLSYRPVWLWPALVVSLGTLFAILMGGVARLRQPLPRMAPTHTHQGRP
jgi:hypothetical protein